MGSDSLATVMFSDIFAVAFVWDGDNNVYSISLYSVIFPAEISSGITTWEDAIPKKICIDATNIKKAPILVKRIHLSLIGLTSKKGFGRGKSLSIRKKNRKKENPINFHF